MNIPDGSMTPPCSPTLQENKQYDTNEGFDHVITPFHELLDSSPVICFTCGVTAPTGNPHPHSFLRQGTLQRLKSGTVDLPINVGGTLCDEVFGEKFLYKDIFKDGLGRLFFHAKKHISQLENLSEVPSFLTSSDTLAKCLSIRKEIIKFFSYLKTCVYRSVTVEMAPSLIPCLLLHLQSLLCHIQRLADLPSYVIASALSSKKSCGRHVFHMHLDLHWSLLELLHIITDHCPDVIRDNTCVWCHNTNTEDIINNDVFSQCVRMLMWDIISLAMKTHSVLSSQQYSQVTPYLCSCVKEMMIMLVQLMSHRQETLGRQSFWDEMFSLLKSILPGGDDNTYDTERKDSDVFNVPSSYMCENPVDFCWWFLVHVAPLFTYDEFGVSQKKQVTSNYPLMEQLLKTSLTLCESQLRRHLQCCLRITELWENGDTMLNMLWEHFYKCLNEQFYFPHGGVSGVACLSKTPVSLLEKCQSLVQVGNFGTDNETSFQLFLRLLAMHLGKSASSNSMLWKKMKGRFYSKFHSRRMLELSEIGLHNVTSLFLTLTYLVNLQDVGSKLFELYHMLDMKTMAVHRHRAIWQGNFALILRFLEQDMDVGFMSEKLVEDFNYQCAELRHSDRRLSPSHELVMFYVDSLQEVMDASALYLHQSQLLGVGLCDLLHCCRVSDLTILLDLIHNLLIRYRVVYKRVDKTHSAHRKSVLLYCRELAVVLWQNFYSFVRVHSCMLTAPPLLADLAAGFTMLLLHSPPDGQTGVRETVKDCFLHFGCSEQVNALISCRYLCHMMPNKDVISRLAVALTNHESRLIQAWLQCSCLLPGDTSMLQELTRLILKLDSVQRIFSKADIDTTNPPDIITCLFIRALAVVYSQLTDLKCKTEMRCEVERYVQGLPGCISVVLKTSSPTTHLNIYSIAGWLVRHCATILYMKSKPNCLLPILLDRLVLPRILLTPSKPVPPHVLSALQETLYLFVEGLGELDFKRDPYIQRKLKDIIVLYLPRFPISSSDGVGVTAIHPLMTSMSESCRVVLPPKCGGLRRYILHVLVTAYLTPCGTAFKLNSNLAMTFVADLFKKTMNQAVLARDCSVMLPATLQYMLCCENTSLKRNCTRVLEMMLEAVRDHPEATDSSVLKDALRGFLAHMNSSHQRVLRVLELVSALCPSIVIDVIPSMTQAVKMSESVRGVGVDRELRLAYHCVLKNLGTPGNEEWSNLLLES